jgi:hypothetical protein
MNPQCGVKYAALSIRTRDGPRATICLRAACSSTLATWIRDIAAAHHATRQISNAKVVTIPGTHHNSLSAARVFTGRCCKPRREAVEPPPQHCSVPSPTIAAKRDLTTAFVANDPSDRRPSSLKSARDNMRSLAQAARCSRPSGGSTRSLARAPSRSLDLRSCADVLFTRIAPARASSEREARMVEVVHLRPVVCVHIRREKLRVLSFALP